MTRKVGFGDNAEDATPAPKKSIADQAMDRFRKRARLKAEREAVQKKSRRSKTTRLLFLIFWLILWVAMSGVIMYAMASEGLNANIVPLVIWTAASVFVVSKVIRSIIKTVTTPEPRGGRPDNF